VFGSAGHSLQAAPAVDAWRDIFLGQLLGQRAKRMRDMRYEWMRSRVAAVVLGIAAVVGGPSAATAEKRFFTIAAIEPEGKATTDKEPFPAEPLPPGGGYVLDQPRQNGRWGVEVYLWQPSQIIVNEGDEVTLEFVGINSRSHPVTISGYEKTFVLKRGHVHRVTFVADKAGVFPFVCATHRPSMTGELVVLAKKVR
jgi:Cupredoxin-like domain